MCGLQGLALVAFLLLDSLIGHYAVIPGWEQVTRLASCLTKQIQCGFTMGTAKTL